MEKEFTPSWVFVSFGLSQKKAPGSDDRRGATLYRPIYSAFDTPAGGFLFFGEKRNKNAYQKKLAPLRQFFGGPPAETGTEGCSLSDNSVLSICVTSVSYIISL